MAQICGAGYWLAAWGKPEVRQAVSHLLESGSHAAAWADWSLGLDLRLVSEGFPPQFGLVTWAPFDYLGDTLRGTRGIVTDLFRRPDKVLEACDRLLAILLKAVVRKAAPFVPPLVFIPLHKGADGFMSEQQFRTFYWPSLRKMCLGLIEQGLVPYLFAEGSYGSRLETIRDLPPGRTVWHFDQTDMRRAKEELGGIACIQGNVPLSLLQLGTAGEVAAYCRKLIDDVKGEGGFILDIGAGADTGKEENFRAMIQTAKEYGTY
jgi:uroporphyrinogen-III decarboxylase